MTTFSPNSQKPFDQLSYLVSELKLIVNYHPQRWVTCWFSGSTHAIISYRLDRCGYLLFKSAWPVLRLFLLPYQMLTRLLGGDHDIHYKADIGRGLKILHPSLGLVISSATIAGEGLLLTGGNCIGVRQPMQPGGLTLGDFVMLGANAVILGPVHIGNHVQVGAGAVVIHDAPDGVVLIGVPAKAVQPQRIDEV